MRTQLFCLLLLALGACSKKKEDPKPFTPVTEKSEKTVTGYFHFQYYYGKKPLLLDSSFTNSLGQVFKLDTISFFLSDLTLIKENGTRVAVPNSLLFENHTTNFSQNLSVKNVPVGDYMNVSFAIGLTPELNKTSSFGTECDFMRFKDKGNGHGFLFISAHLVSDPSKRMKYMIGTNELLRRVSLPIKPFTVFESQPYFFHYNVDVAPFLYNLNFDKEDSTNSIENKSLAVTIADNIPTVFTYGTHH